MKRMKDTMMVLAGDIGGTKMVLGLFVKGKTRPRLKTTETYSSQKASNLEEIVALFLEKHNPSVSGACFGIAGPVRGGRSRVTNLPWYVSEKEISKRFGWDRVRLINDLAATAYAVPLLTKKEVFPLNDVKAPPREPIGLVAPGTGLGQALLVFVEERYVPLSSEGGHVDFAPNTEEEVHLWRYLRGKWGHVSIERILSGPGLFDVYSWLRDSGKHREPKWLADALQENDPARVISESALTRAEPLCRAALDTFVSILGAVCGNLALTALTMGGIYLGGGIPPKILEKLKESRFLETFTNKGRFKDLMAQIPVRVILNDRAALIGAAQCAFSLDL